MYFSSALALLQDFFFDAWSFVYCSQFELPLLELARRVADLQLPGIPSSWQALHPQRSLEKCWSLRSRLVSSLLPVEGQLVEEEAVMVEGKGIMRWRRIGLWERGWESHEKGFENTWRMMKLESLDCQGLYSVKRLKFTWGLQSRSGIYSRSTQVGNLQHLICAKREPLNN